MKRTILALLLSISVNAMDETALVPITHTPGFEILRQLIVDKIQADKINNRNQASCLNRESFRSMGASDAENRAWTGITISNIRKIMEWTTEERNELFETVKNIVSYQETNKDFAIFALWALDPIPAVEFLKILHPNPISPWNIFQHYQLCIKQSFCNVLGTLYNNNHLPMQQYFLEHCIGLFRDNHLSFLYLPKNLYSMLITPRTPCVGEFIESNYDFLIQKMREAPVIIHHQTYLNTVEDLFDFVYFCSVWCAYEIIKGNNLFLTLLRRTKKLEEAQKENTKYTKYFQKDFTIQQTEKIKNLMSFIDRVFSTQIRTESEIAKYVEFKGGWEKISSQILERLILLFEEEEGIVPECLRKNVNTDIRKLRAITFIQDLAQLAPEDFEKKEIEEKKVEELPLVPQHQELEVQNTEAIAESFSLPEIPRKDFASLKKDFLNLFEKEDYDTIQYLINSNFTLMPHVLSWFVKEQRDLLKKSPTYISEIIMKKNNSYQEMTDNKPEKKSKKTTKITAEQAQKAIKSIQAANPKNKMYKVLKKDYRSEYWYLNKRDIQWTALSKGLAQLGACVRDEKNKHKITFYIAGTEKEPFLVTREEYNMVNGSEKFKHEITRTSHFNHEDSEILDPGFLDDIFKTLQALTEQ